jgi:hypothetical protein
VSRCPKGGMADRPCGWTSYWPLILMETLMLMLYCSCLSCHCDSDCVFDCKCDCVVSWSVVHGLRSNDLSLRMVLQDARQDWILTRVKDVQMET